MSRRKARQPGRTRLRRRAERLLGGAPATTARPAPPRAQRLHHELQVYQVALEMQKTELRRTRVRLRAARDRYRELYDLAPLGWLRLHPGGGTRDASGGARAL